MFAIHRQLNTDPHLIFLKCNDSQDNITINQMNAFQLIGMSSCLDFSGFFEKEDVSERKIRFASNYSPAYLFEKMECIVTKMGFQAQKGNGKLKVIQDCKRPTASRGYESLLISAEVFILNHSSQLKKLMQLLHHGPSVFLDAFCILLTILPLYHITL